MADKKPSDIHPLLRGQPWTKGYAAGRRDAEAVFGCKTDTAIAARLPSTGSLSFANLKSPEELESALKVKSELEKLPELERARVLRKLIRENERELEREAEAIEAKQRELESERATLTKMREAFDEINAWAATSLKLERPSEPSFWQLRHAERSKSTIHIAIPPAKQPYDYETEIFRKAQVFAIEHDWAAAFARSDIDAAFKLPYEVCAFDFHISGRPVIGLATQVDDHISLSVATKSPFGWVIPGAVYSHAGGKWASSLTPSLTEDDNFAKVIVLVGSQIKAIAIALDAEVAKIDMMRAAHQGQLGKNAHAPLRSYHVVSLARRQRSALLSESTPSGRHKRLHFRRGHWRHFPAFKTWIKWTLVGDPDLGFVDKHYKL